MGGASVSPSVRSFVYTNAQFHSLFISPFFQQSLREGARARAHARTISFRKPEACPPVCLWNSKIPDKDQIVPREDADGSAGYNNNEKPIKVTTGVAWVVKRRKKRINARVTRVHDLRDLRKNFDRSKCDRSPIELAPTREFAFFLADLSSFSRTSASRKTVPDEERGGGEGYPGKGGIVKRKGARPANYRCRVARKRTQKTIAGQRQVCFSATPSRS